MARPRILNVGQCGYDHSQISRTLAKDLDAEILAVDTHAEAMENLRSLDYQLVLVNRVGDADGAPGLDLIRALKSDPATAEVPVILVSNFPDAQDEAVKAGAVRGFGKAEIGREPYFEAIRQALGRPS